MTAGVSLNPGAQLTIPSSFTIEVTRSSVPSSARITASRFRPVRRAAATPSSSVRWRPTLPITSPSGPAGPWPDT